MIKLEELIDEAALLERTWKDTIDIDLGIVMTQMSFHDSWFTDANLKIGLLDLREKIDMKVNQYWLLDKEFDWLVFKNLLCTIIESMTLSDLQERIDEILELTHSFYLWQVRSFPETTFNEKQFPESTKNLFYYSKEACFTNHADFITEEEIVTKSFTLWDLEYTLEYVSDDDYLGYICYESDNKDATMYVNDFLLSKLVNGVELPEDIGDVLTIEEFNKRVHSLRLESPEMPTE